jgi:DNA repair protein RecN (Recombination protein N)
VASGVTRLSDSARIEEIARMLAGLEDSSSAREHAAELLALRG